MRKKCGIQKIMCGLLFPALLCTSCSKDEEMENALSSDNSPIGFALSTVSGMDEIAWGDLKDERVAVRIDGIVKAYQIAENGLSAAEPFLWQGQDTVYVDAWYPYSQRMPRVPIVKVSQDTEEGYRSSNLLTVTAHLTPDNTTMPFVRRTSKLECVMEKGALADPSLDLSQARVSFLHVLGVEVGTTVHANQAHRAYIAPQTIEAGTEFVVLEWPDGKQYTAALEKDYTFEEGQSYSIKVTVGAGNGGVSVDITQNPVWDVTDEEVGGNSSTVNPGGNPGDWTGESEEGLSGNSSTVNPGGNPGDWAGESEEDLSGNSSTVNPGDNPGDWTGEYEEVSGTKQEAVQQNKVKTNK